jgi:hypothetical protein
VIATSPGENWKGRKMELTVSELDKIIVGEMAVQETSQIREVPNNSSTEARQVRN